jgi:ubiquinol-cytochrome c reductase iron-sulfur subunit
VSSPQARATRWITLALVATTLCGLGLAVTYVAGGSAQVQGVLLAIALGGLGASFILLSRHLLPPGPVTEEREPLVSAKEDRQAFANDFSALIGEDEPLGRRRFLFRVFAAAAAALGLAALFPLASLGPNINRKLKRTAWTKGARLVDTDGKPIKVGTLEVGGITTVFPEGHLDAADSQTLLIRVSTTPVTTRSGRQGWGPEGYLAYSKICTHAGCPVGLYQHKIEKLLCPCHQSTFAVLEGAKPIFGPATRSLPQLPLEVDSDGYLRAQSDYHEPVGPGFWDRGR